MLRVAGAVASLRTLSFRNSPSAYTTDLRGLSPFDIVSSKPPEQRVPLLVALLVEREKEYSNLLSKEKDLLSKEKDLLSKEKDLRIKEKKDLYERIIDLKDSLHCAQRSVARAFHSAGVVDGRSMLEHVLNDQRPKGVEEEPRADAWRRKLANDAKLLQCLLANVPEWKRAVGSKSKAEQREFIASKIVAVHDSLRRHMHTFWPDVGLTIYEGVPDAAATAVLRCVAERNGIPYELKACAGRSGRTR